MPVEKDSKTFTKLFKLANFERDDVELKITRDQNWKFEISILVNGVKIFRLKFYNKTAEILTSMGVMIH